MKLLSSFLLGSTFATHFRGATWLTQINDDGDLELIFPQTWRRGYSGFSGKFQDILGIPGSKSSGIKMGHKYCSNYHGV